MIKYIMTIPDKTWDNFSELINKAERILILNPKDSDGDSLGASLALMHYFQSLNKECVVFAGKPPSNQFEYLPGFERISTDISKLDFPQYNLIIAVDFADLKMLDLPKESISQLIARPLVNIDHHPTNHQFGSINIVEPTAAATTEIIFHFFENLNISYDKIIATCLLTGIVYDTGGFAHANTTRGIIDTASRLLIKGARLRRITTAAQSKSLPTLKLWGVALSRLTYNPRFGLSTTVITQNDLEEHDTNEESVEGIANFLNNLSGAKAIMVLKQEPDNKIKGSLRTTTPGIDVSRLATELGGGGHKRAAGFTVQGKLKHNGRHWQVS